MKVTLDHTEDIAENIRTFWFKPERPVRYIAGQFIEMTLPHEGTDKRGQKRWFTLSSSPSEELVSVTTKHAVGQVSTFKQTLFGLEPGAEISLSEPMGDFVLPKDTSIPLVFVAGGIGITPMRSMVKFLIDSDEKRSVQIIYGARTLDEVSFRDLFESYGAKLDIVLSEQSKDWSGRTGVLGAELILELAGNDPNQLIYVSGPEPMVETLENDLKKAGVNKRKLVLDFFPNYSASY
jgi:ferredoxin-NADP reductase